MLVDTVQDVDAPIMNLSIKKVGGIDEPVSLISEARFAVGASSNSIYSYGIFLEQPESESETEEQQQLESAIQDPILSVPNAIIIPYAEGLEVLPEGKISAIKSI